MAKRDEIDPNCQPSLFGTDERIAPDSKTQPVVRQFDHSRILIGTSAFTAAGWAGSFYPVGVFVNSQNNSGLYLHQQSLRRERARDDQFVLEATE
jgi:hypothetical protein